MSGEYQPSEIVLKFSQLWATHGSQHGSRCPCFGCSEVRRAYRRPPLEGAMPPESPEQIAARRGQHGTTD